MVTLVSKERTIVRSITLAIILGVLGVQAIAQQPTPAVRPNIQNDGTPVVLARATQYDITSRVNGETYRVMVSTPFMADPAVAYPVLYVLDGNAWFETANDTLLKQSESRIASPAIVVGVGYPTDDRPEWGRRRNYDLTFAEDRAPSAQGRSGGADLFLRMVEEEIKPFVAARYKVDRTRQIIWGHSYGGLTALRSLFRNPTAFSTYILSSPSIWYNGGDVLADEEAFSKRARGGELHLKILITSAGDEQYRGSDPQRQAADNRMVDNASDLAARLKALNSRNITVARTIFDGEVHNTVAPASLSRAVHFALARE